MLKSKTSQLINNQDRRTVDPETLTTATCVTHVSLSEQENYAFPLKPVGNAACTAANTIDFAFVHVLFSR